MVIVCGHINLLCHLIVLFLGGAKYDNNVFFFSDAVRKYGDIHQFSKTYCKICNNEKLLYDQLSQQVYIGSKIIDHKFKSVQKSVKYLAYSFIYVVLLLVLWLTMLF